jgi:hypothetical protein
MDVGKCVALHNRILRVGWRGSGKSDSDFDRECKSWFDYYGVQAEAMRDVLPPDLVAFLEQAYVAPSSRSFFYYVNGLCGPDSLINGADLLNTGWGGADGDRFVVLCSMNTFKSHAVGVV